MIERRQKGGIEEIGESKRGDEAEETGVLSERREG